MTVKAQVDIDVVYHDQDGGRFVLGAVSEHIRPAVTVGHHITGSVGTTPQQLVAQGPLSTLAIRNIGSAILRVAGAIDVPPGRTTVLPVSSSVTLQSSTGTAEYTAIWIG